MYEYLYDFHHKPTDFDTTVIPQVTLRECNFCFVI